MMNFDSDEEESVGSLWISTKSLLDAANPKSAFRPQKQK
jgi:hypothetical protein